MDARLQILIDTFQQRFEPERFLRFAIEFFGNLKILNPDREREDIPKEYEWNVRSYTTVASYAVAGETLDVFTVRLWSGKGRTIERARSMQRSFVSHLLKNSNHEGAIVAFYTDDDPRWRLSLIRLDYEFAAGRVKTKLTPARRYSYLVGEKEPCHTAMAQLYPIFRDENFNPSLDRIEEAFSVERVTKDFYEAYKDKYHDLREHLERSDDFIEESVKCGFTSEQFAKKLMGQLAFLYFLQKKGWLGIPVLPRRLTSKEYDNAFYKLGKASREVIPQVYKKVSADEYRLDTRGIQALSDDDADVAARCFKTEEWGKGEKAFIRHLFTSCKERNFFDEYLEPLFYEALNQKRGDSSYYKRFNCKIPFLNGGLFDPIEGYDWQHSEFDIPNEIFSNIETKGERDADGILDIFDQYNFTMNEDEPLEREVAIDPEMLGKIFENLLDAKDRKSKGAFYTPREIVHYMCSESLVNYLVGKTDVPDEDMKAFIVNGELMKDEDWNSRGERRIPQTVFENLREIDKALETIKVADPAVGSGAFPLGMLSEIVKARNNITYYYAAMLKTAEERARLFAQRNLYDLKLKTIQNSIFAVDIEASAVDIAKLRLWLSLVVDEDLSPSYEEQRWGLNEAIQKDPRPLPNLDYNIMCGNSLIDEFEGIQLFDDSLLDKDSYDTAGGQTNMQMSLFADVMKDYLDELRKEQERLFGEQNQDVKHEIKHKIDTIIDNVIRAKLDRDSNAEGLRKYEEVLKQKTKPYFLWKLEFTHVFRENGGFDVVIGNPPYVSAVKNTKSDTGERDYWRNKYPALKGAYDLYAVFLLNGISLTNSNGVFSWIIPNKLLVSKYSEDVLKVLDDNGLKSVMSISHIPIFDNASVYPIIILGNKNEKNRYKVFTVETVNELGTDKPTEKVTMKTHKTFAEYGVKFGSGATGFQAKKLVEYISDTNLQGSIPFIVSGSVDRYTINYNNVRYMGNKYNEPYITKGNGIADSKWSFWCNEKVVIAGMTKVIEAVYCQAELALGVGIYAIYDYAGFNPKYLTAILNSKYLSYFLNTEFREKHLAGGYLAINKSTLELLPLVNASYDKQEYIASLVDKITDSDSMTEISRIENEIDRLVYSLFELSEDEIVAVEDMYKPTT